MGKKNDPNQSHSDSDATSTASLDSETIGNDTNTLAESSLSEQLDNLTEERPTARSYALDILHRGLVSYRPEWTSNNKVTLGGNLRRCVIRGGRDEVVLAFKVAGITCVTLGKESSELLDDWADTLIKMCTNPNDIFHKEHALVLFALMCLLCDEEGTYTQKCLDIAQNILERKSHESSHVMVSAAHVWALLVSALPHKVVANKYYDQAVQMFSELLATESVDIRVTAGENLALLVDLFASGSDETKPEHPYSINDSLPGLIENLVTECSKNRSKKDKLKQRTAFRFISDTLDSGETPCERIVVRTRALDFEGWRQLCLLDFLRSILGSGFQHHLFENEVVGELLDINIPKTKPNLSKEEKKHQQHASNSASKERYAKRDNQRKQKTSHMVSSGGDEGGDDY
eukprot:c8487_g1_i1.p1 GENE.c8487_g1_i1~~c8487_g1_i1.p1  ORF type:complete len:402 (-),score=90.29 c8487_g1_i1:288-1493(-)